MAPLPLFPLETVLFPHQPIALTVFEDHYKTLIRDITSDAHQQFGVALIERGAEVGGVSTPFPLGVVATIQHLHESERDIEVAAVGGRRFIVDSLDLSLGYPVADVIYLPELSWRDSLSWDFAAAEVEVRAALDGAPCKDHRRCPSDVPLSADPIIALWQLAEMVPINPLDQLFLLEATSPEQLIDRIREFANEAKLPMGSGFTEDVA
jgi:Lon protease-like protein